MKKILIISIVFLIPMFAFSADDFDFDEIPKEVRYCHVIGVSFALDTPPVITINFGQKWIARKTIKRGGKVFSFNNMIDVLNWMYANGWEYRSYLILNNGMAGFWHYYLLERKDN